MTLEQIIKEVDRLDDQEFKRLLEHIERRRKQVWGQAFDQAVEALRADLTREEITEMVQAMNVEHVKPLDDDRWRE